MLCAHLAPVFSFVFLTKSAGASGLMPAIGITLEGQRIQTRCVVLSIPNLMAHGVVIPKESKYTKRFLAFEH